LHSLHQLIHPIYQELHLHHQHLVDLVRSLDTIFNFVAAIMIVGSRLIVDLEHAFEQDQVPVLLPLPNFNELLYGIVKEIPRALEVGDAFSAVVVRVAQGSDVLVD
jgi:hypothetical protein